MMDDQLPDLIEIEPFQFTPAIRDEIMECYYNSTDQTDAREKVDDSRIMHFSQFIIEKNPDGTFSKVNYH